MLLTLTMIFLLLFELNKHNLCILIIFILILLILNTNYFLYKLWLEHLYNFIIDGIILISGYFHQSLMQFYQQVIFVIIVVLLSRHLFIIIGLYYLTLNLIDRVDMVVAGKADGVQRSLVVITFNIEAGIIFGI